MRCFIGLKVIGLLAVGDAGAHVGGEVRQPLTPPLAQPLSQPLVSRKPLPYGDGTVWLLTHFRRTDFGGTRNA